LRVHRGTVRLVRISGVVARSESQRRWPRAIAPDAAKWFSAVTRQSYRGSYQPLTPQTILSMQLLKCSQRFCWRRCQPQFRNNYRLPGNGG